MRLVVKKNGRKINEFRFAEGPIHIGRHTHSQILLPDAKVSRQHAVIFKTQDGIWMINDLDSANKTYLNDKAIHQGKVKTGDRLSIGDFRIEIDLEDDSGKQVHLEDTLVTTVHRPRVIARKLDAEQAPEIKLPASRAKDFIQASRIICQANGEDEVLKVLLDLMIKQFAAYQTWGTLREEPAGPMTSQAGKRRNGQKIQLDDLTLGEKISQIAEKNIFVLMPQVPGQDDIDPSSKVRSAIIVPVLGAKGCLGVLYLDNDMNQEQYTLSDLDYLMLLAIHTAAILENF